MPAARNKRNPKMTSVKPSVNRPQTTLLKTAGVTKTFAGTIDTTQPSRSENSPDTARAAPTTPIKVW